MAIKYLQFTFAVPMTQLLGMIATGDVGMKIDAIEDNKDLKKQLKKQLNGQTPKLLEGPSEPLPRNRGKDQHGNPVTAYEAILRAMAAKPDHTEALQTLRPMVEKLGLKASSANSQISLMVRRDQIRRASEGIYRLTATGLRECVRRGIKVKGLEEKKETSPAKLKKKPKPVKAPSKVETTEAPKEAANG